MTIFQRNPVARALKAILQATLYRPGTTATILRGPMKGQRYLITPTSGWAPIYGGWEPEAQEVYRVLIAPGDVVFDVGANVGIHVLVFARLVGQSGQVVAFEPLPENTREIERNSKMNGFLNVRIVEAAASSSPGKATFKLGEHAGQGSLVGIGKETGHEVEVSLVTLDSQVSKGQSAPAFVKIDVEGVEADVLAGFGRTIDNVHPTFSIDLHTPEQDVAVGTFLSSKGYKLFRVGDDVARRGESRRGLLLPIEHTTSGWPDPVGVWGTIVAVHPAHPAYARLSGVL